MKRVLCIFLCLCCFAGMIGCSAEHSAPKNTVAVYYKREKPVYGTADGVIADRYPNVCPCAEGAVADVIYKKIPEILKNRA